MPVLLVLRMQRSENQKFKVTRPSSAIHSKFEAILDIMRLSQEIRVNGKKATLMLVLAGLQVPGASGVSGTMPMKSIWDAGVVYLLPCKSCRTRGSGVDDSEAKAVRQNQDISPGHPLASVYL